FHRVIKGFMNQGGGFDTNRKEKTTKAPIKNEWRNGLSNTRGTLAMARTREPDSATAQFFINAADNKRLDQASPQTGFAGYCVFGKVIEGMDVVDKINNAATKDEGGAFTNVPAEPIVIKSIRRAETK
ncbi:MAG TPA: peptidylprolyl isomerase, partial [Gemmataceae bacterium]|nr:peptidylprolyl isomerase [Gemmataceae bacterium]